MATEWAIAGLVIIIVVALLLRRRIRLAVTRKGVTLNIDVPHMNVKERQRPGSRNDKAAEFSG